jgi:hypothetical protein
MCTQADHQLISVPSLLQPSTHCPSAADNTPEDKGVASFEDAEDDTEDSEDSSNISENRDMSEIDYIYRDEDDEERKKKESISGLRKEESTARLRKEDDDAGKIRTGRERRNAPGK